MSVAVDLPQVESHQVPPAGGRSLPWHRLIGAIGIVLAAIGMASADLSRISGLGLLPVPSPLYYVGVALVLIWAVTEIARPSQFSTFWFALSLIAVVLLLHGLPGFIETNPRFSVAYTHVGFADQIARNGKLLPLVDARFSWASFFAGSALLQRATGDGSLLWVVRFFPVVLTLIACGGTIILGRLMAISVQRCRLAALFFALLSWVGQDYFAPQAMSYILYLAIICCVLLVFPGTGPAAGSRRARWLRPRALPQIELPLLWQRIVLGVLVIMSGALVTSHQLTPGFLAVALILLGIVNATRLRGLGWIVGVMTAGWLSYAAVVYWTGHISHIFGSTGDVGVLVKQNLGNRTTGGGQREIVVASRIGLSAALFVAIMVAVFFLWRRRDLPLPLVMLTIAPIPLLALQAYGGEMPLRVFFFLLPSGTLLLAEAFGAVGRWRLPRHALTTALTFAIVPVFLLARFGNESFEQVAKQDRDVLSSLYAQAPNHTYVYILNGISVKYLERINDVRFPQLRPGVSAAAILKRMEGTRDRAGRFVTSQYFMVNHTQELSGIQQYGLAPGWTGRTVNELLKTGDYKVVAHEDDAYLLKFYPPAKRKP